MVLASGRDSNAEPVKSSRMVSVINQQLSSVPLFLWEHSVDYLSSSPYSPVNDKAHAHPFIPRSDRSSYAANPGTGGNALVNGSEPTVSAEEILETCDVLRVSEFRIFFGFLRAANTC